MNSVIKLFILNSFVIFAQGQLKKNIKDIRIGSPCKISASGKIGSCQRPENCTSLIESSEVPQTKCFTGESGPIFCCHDPPIRISQEKCIDFFLKSTIKYNNDEVIKNGTVVSIYGEVSPFGGELAAVGEFKQMAAIGWLVDGKTDQIDFKCGGTLIDPRYVVTAAHCMGTPPNIIRLGGVSVSNKTIQPDDILITESYIHPNYTSTRSYNDIALLKLNTIVKKNLSVPACLWTNEKVNFTTLVATGYGQTSFGGPTTDDLIKVNLKYFDNSVCNGIFDDEDSRYANGIVDNQLCAGLEQGKQDTCPGDSGGPIGVKIVQTNAEKTEEIFYLIGVTSFGSGCGGADAAVYTRISSFLDWIESIVWYVH